MGGEERDGRSLQTPMTTSVLEIRAVGNQTVGKVMECLRISLRIFVFVIFLQNICRYDVFFCASNRMCRVVSCLHWPKLRTQKSLTSTDFSLDRLQVAEVRNRKRVHANCLQFVGCSAIRDCFCLLLLKGGLCLLVRSWNTVVTCLQFFY